MWYQRGCQQGGTGHCVRVHVCASGTHTCACALQGACTYPNGPRSDLIRSGSKKVLQLQSRIASLDDPAQGTGGEKYGFERGGPNYFGLFITADGHEFTSAAGPHSSQLIKWIRWVTSLHIRHSTLQWFLWLITKLDESFSIFQNSPRCFSLQSLKKKAAVTIFLSIEVLTWEQ